MPLLKRNELAPPNTLNCESQANSQFRQAYDLFREVIPRRADRRYLEILELAAKEGEARVEDALRLLLASAAWKTTLINQEAFRDPLERCERVPDITDVRIAAVPPHRSLLAERYRLFRSVEWVRAAMLIHRD
jgi:hypothetical protein